AQHALGEGREGDDADAELAAGVDGSVLLDPAVEDRIARLVDEQRHAHLAQDGVGLPRLLLGIARYADIERLALAVELRQRAHRLLERRRGVVAVGVEY